jgi:hypothetical protein
VNVGLAFLKHHIELSEISKVRNRKASSEPFCKPAGQIFNDPLTLLGPLLTFLNFLYDFPANQPVSENRIAIDRPHNIAASLFQDVDNSVKQVALLLFYFLFVHVHRMSNFDFDWKSQIATSIFLISLGLIPRRLLRSCHSSESGNPVFLDSGKFVVP